MRSRRASLFVARHEEDESLELPRRRRRRHQSTFGKVEATSPTAAIRGETPHGYVQTWLDHTTARAPESYGESLPPSGDLPGSPDVQGTATAGRTWRPRHLPVDGHFDELDLPRINQRQQKITQGRRRSRSPDSSIIPSPKRRRRGSRSDRFDAVRGTKRRRPSTPPHDEASLDREEKPSRFEKRARHKTRVDRYDFGAGGRPSAGSRGQDKSTAKKPRSEKRRTARITSARDVMGNFASKAILNERLTVRRGRLSRS